MHERLACLLMCLLLPPVALSQRGSTIHSLEWLAADASLILRGHVVSIEQIPGKPDFKVVRFHAEETLKGSKQTDFEFAVISQVDDSIQASLERWGRDGKPALLFLTESAKCEQADPAFRRHRFATRTGFLPEAMLELDPNQGVQVVTTEFESLSDPKEILACTREAIRAVPASKKLASIVIEPGWGFKFTAPRWVHRGDGLSVIVPVDDRLERHAREWTKSPTVECRECGVKALAPFKSYENIVLVRRLLNDLGTTTIDYVMEKPMDVPVVREAAKDVLDGWDVTWETVSPASMAAAREMVRVPAGAFIMGDKDAEMAAPARKVKLGEYWIGKTDVTVAQFRAFCKATSFKFRWAKNDARPYKDDHPMVNVNWYEARAFCKWVGGDLPTEAQWEKAARGTDGRRFPWGNWWDAARLQCEANTHVGWHTTAPVGSFASGASPYGCLDMAGNVFQMCLDCGPPARDKSTEFKGLRGGDWEEESDDLRFYQCAGRGFMMPGNRSYDAGFRVVARRKLRLP